MQTTQQKVIGIVLEAAEPALVDEWCRQGKLPVLERLRHEGVYTRLASPSYISSGCSWPTLNIGTNPAKHGIGFFHREIKSGTYRIIKKYADQVHGKPFWTLLGRAGYRSAIFDLATTLPSPDPHCMIVVDWGSEHPSWKMSSYPESLIEDIVRVFGRHPLADWYQGGVETREQYKAVADKILSGVELRTKALLHMLDKDDFDFVFCNYSEPHWAGHMFWHLHDVQHPEHNPEHAAYCGDVILQTYQACDRAVGKLEQRYPGANILVMSNIGIGSHSGGDMMAPEILERLGMSAPPRTGVRLQRLKKSLLPGTSGPISAVQRVEKIVPPALIMRIRKLFPERIWDEWTRRLLGLGNSWADSLAFLLPADNSSLIRINLRGREPRGRVQPGEEYQRLCSELASAFMELVDPATGEGAVEKVVILREHLQGDQMDQLPDLAVVWKNHRVPIEALESARIGRVEIPEYNKRSGGHWHEGFLIGSGPAFRSGVSLDGNDLVDVAPTILALFGVAAPDYMDGRVITEALLAE
jgi:predicted AlkP superfamily phosphohydrolase/phosphomutase